MALFLLSNTNHGVSADGRRPLSDALSHATLGELCILMINDRRKIAGTQMPVEIALLATPPARKSSNRNLRGTKALRTCSSAREIDPLTAATLRTSKPHFSMKDLTQGSISGHLVSMALPTAAGLMFQALYLFIDLYFVAGLGGAAVAGVSAAGNVMFIIFALTQTLGVGTVALISHEVGRKDHQKIELIFNQSLVMAVVCGAFSMIAGYLLAVPYMSALSEQEETVSHGRDYLFWFLPGIALQFPLVAMGAALRGIGIVRPVVVAQVVTVLLNAGLAPLLIAGWGMEWRMGVAGAGLASSIAAFGGAALLSVSFNRQLKYVPFRLKKSQPSFEVWRRILTVGWPAGGELLLMFVYSGITFWAIASFGPEAQASFGIGWRIMQGIFLPAVAIAFAVTPIAGQNFGAQRMDRVRETIRIGSMQTIGVMLLAMLLCQWQPEILVRFFSPEPEVVRIGASFLHLISWSFVLSAVTLVYSGAFQALGNSLPSLVSSLARLALYFIAILWLTTRPNYRLEHVWYVSIAAAAAQTVLNVWFLRRQLQRRTIVGTQHASATRLYQD